MQSADVRFAVFPEGFELLAHINDSSAIPFQVLWQLSVSEGKLGARIERLKAGFLSIGFLKTVFTKCIAAATESQT